jgi:hypothetical protein
MTTQNHKDRAHALFSASASDRWITCPASLMFEKQFKKEESQAASEGTKAHEIAEAILLGKPYPKDDLEMVRHGKAYADYVNDIAGVDGVIHTERRVYYGGAIGQPKDLAFGTCDNIVIAPNRNNYDLHIIDYKYGFNEVSAENNYQLMMYALGVLCNTKKTFKKAHLHIYQPRIGNISTWTTIEQDLYYFSNVAELAARNALYDNPQFNPQPKACRWCAAKGNCKALADSIKADFQDLIPESTELIPESTELNPKSPNTLGTKELGYILSRADMIRSFLKEAETAAYNRIKDGEQVDGYKLVNKKARAKWNDKAIKELPEKLGEAAYRPQELITITDAKKLIPIDEIVDLTSKNAEGYGACASK